MGNGSAVGLFALWLLAGLTTALSFFGMLSIGIFVLPFAAALVILAVWMTTRGPGRWPSVAGMGAAFGLALVWFGVVLGRSSLSAVTCRGSSDGPTVCTTADGRPWDPDAFQWPSAAPWLALGVAVFVGSLTAFVIVRRVTAPPRRVVGSPAR